MKKNTENKRTERQRKRDAGFVPLEVWVKREYKDKVKRFVKKLNEH